MKKILLLLFALTVINFAQDSTKTLKKGVILFNSDPVGAQVCVNDSLCGITPLEVFNWKTGIYNFKFIKDSLEVNKYNILYTAGENKEIFAVLHSDYALLSVNSVPEGATVYLDGDSLGTTPLIKEKIPVATHILEIIKDDYISWETKFIAKANLYEFAERLNFGKGIIKLQDDGYQYFIDDNRVKSFSDELKLNIGFHKIRVSGNNLHREFTEDFELQPRQIKSIKFNYGHKDYTPLLYSIFLPGLGQIIDGEVFKGSSIMAANLILSGLSILKSQDYSEKLDNYNSTVEQYKNLGASNEFKIIEISKKMDEKYNTAKDAQKVRNYMIGAFIVSYVYNLIDAYLFHATGGDITIINEAAPINSLESQLSLKLKLGL